MAAAGCTCATCSGKYGICPRCHSSVCPAAHHHVAACVADGSLGLKAAPPTARGDTFGTWRTGGTTPDDSGPLSHHRDDDNV